MALIDIGEVCRATGVAPSALRFYEDRGLITSAARRGLRRQYDEDVLDRLALILMCQKAGFTLAEIDAVLGTGGGPAWKALARRKLLDTEAQIATLERIADGLRHALECPSPNVLRCAHFRAELERTLVEHRAGTAAGAPLRPA